MNRAIACATTALTAPIAFTAASGAAFVAQAGWWQHSYFQPAANWLPAWFTYLHTPGMMLPLLAGGAAGCLAAFAVGSLLLKTGKQKLHGEAKWQTMWGAWRSGLSFTFKPPADGIVMGKWGPLYVSSRGEEHVSLTARTGAGKGVSFVVPNALNWGGPLFCFSVKRDVLLAAAAERERLGDQVFIFDVTDPNGETHCWSGFGEARRGTPEIYDDVQRVMTALIPETKATTPYWDNAARNIATAIGVLLAETEGAALNVASILRIIESADYSDILHDMINQSRLTNKRYPAAAVDTILTWLNSKAEVGAAGVRENIITALALWHIPRVATATNTSDFDLSKIRSSRVSIFVCAQSSDIRRLRPLFSLFFSELIHVNSRNEFGSDPTHRPIRTLGIFDERWAIGSMPAVDDALAFIRSFGIRVCTVLQTKDQLRTSLGIEGARNLFNNAGYELIYGGTDQETAKEVSERSGTDTVEETSRSRPKFGFMNLSKHNENLANKGRLLMLPQEVARLPSDVVVVQKPGQPPLKLKRIFWYKDKAFRYKAGEPPPMPKLNVAVELDQG